MSEWFDQREADLQKRKNTLLQALSQRSTYQYNPNAAKDFMAQQQLTQPKVVKQDTSDRHTLLDTLKGFANKELNMIKSDASEIAGDWQNKQYGEFAKDLIGNTAGYTPIIGSFERGMIKGNDNIDKGLGAKAGANFTAGVGDLVKGIGDTTRWLTHDQAGKGLSNFAEKNLIKPYEQNYSKKFGWHSLLDPEWYATSGSRSLPFMLSMLIPGGAEAKLGMKAGEAITNAAKMSGFAKTITKAAISGAATIPTAATEAAFEAAQVYDQAKTDGHDDATAHEMANKTFKGNMALLSATEAPEFGMMFAPFLKGAAPEAGVIANSLFKRFGKTAGKIAGSAAIEGGQEVGQQMIQDNAQNKKTDWNSALEQGALGAVMGGGMTAATHAIDKVNNRQINEASQESQPENADPFHSIRQQLGGADPQTIISNNVRNRMSDELKNTVDDLRDNLEQNGLPPEEIDGHLNDFISTTEEGKSLIEEETNRLVERMNNPQAPKAEEQANQEADQQAKQQTELSPEHVDFLNVMKQVPQEALKDTWKQVFDQSGTTIDDILNDKNIAGALHPEDVQILNELKQEQDQTDKPIMDTLEAPSNEQSYREDWYKDVKEGIKHNYGTPSFEELTQQFGEQAATDMMNRMVQEGVIKQSPAETQINAPQQTESQPNTNVLEQQPKAQETPSKTLEQRREEHMQKLQEKTQESNFQKGDTIRHSATGHVATYLGTPNPKNNNLVSVDLDGKTVFWNKEKIEKTDAVDNSTEQMDEPNNQEDLTPEEEAKQQEQKDTTNTDRKGEKFLIGSTVKVKGLSDHFIVEKNHDNATISLKNQKTGATLTVGRAAATLVEGKKAETKQEEPKQVEIKQEVTTRKDSKDETKTEIPLSQRKEFHIARSDVEGATLEPESKPQGLYLMIYDGNQQDFKSEHSEAGEHNTFGILKPKNMLVAEEIEVEHARFRPFSKGPASAGVSALKQLVDQHEFNRLIKMNKKDLISLLNEKYPGPDYTQYGDSYELLEAYAGQLARDKGYDAILLEDTVDPGLTEIVALKNNVISFEGGKKEVSSNQKELKPSEQPKEEKQSKNKALVTTQAGTEIKVQYKIVESNDLIASNDVNGKVNSTYPKELQPRDRTSADSQEQINQIARTLDPLQLGENRLASQGAPIIGSDNVVESGNGRFIAIQKIYKDDTYNQQRLKYLNWLVNNVEKFGIDKQSLENFQHPVLVRERLTKVDREKFVAEANESSVSSMGATETALADAKKIKSIIHLFVPSESGEINTAQNQEFIKKYINDVVPSNERREVRTKEGYLSQDGKERLERSLFALAYDDAKTIARYSEDLDDNARTVTGAMVDVAPKMAVLNNEIENSSILKEFDISHDLIESFNKLVELRRKGENIKKWIDEDKKQESLFAETKLSPVAYELLNQFDKLKSRNKIRAMLANYIGYALNDNRATGQDLFGDQATKEEFLQIAIERMNGGGDLFELETQTRPSENSDTSKKPRTENQESTKQEEVKQPSQETYFSPVYSVMGHEVTMTATKDTRDNTTPIWVVRLASKEKIDDWNQVTAQMKKWGGRYYGSRVSGAIRNSWVFKSDPNEHFVTEKKGNIETPKNTIVEETPKGDTKPAQQEKPNKQETEAPKTRAKKEEEMLNKLKDFFDEADGTGKTKEEMQAAWEKTIKGTFKNSQELLDFLNDEGGIKNYSKAEIDVLKEMVKAEKTPTQQPPKNVQSDKPKVEPTKFDKAHAQLKWLDDLADRAEDYWNKNKNRSNALPLDLYAVGVIMGARKMAHGAIDFAQWSEEMVKHYGEELRLSLKGLYAQSEAFLNDFSHDEKMTYLEQYGVKQLAEGLQNPDEVINEDEQQTLENKNQNEEGGKTNESADQVREDVLRESKRESSGSISKNETKEEPGTNSDQAAGTSEKSNSTASRTGNDAERSGGSHPTSTNTVTDEGQSNGVEDDIQQQFDKLKQIGTNYRISNEDNLNIEGKKTTAKRNLDIIKLALQIYKESRLATEEEKKQLVRYTGWGGLKDALDHDWMIKQDWKELNKEIKAILTPEQYKMAQDSRENAHYTSKEAIQGIYQGLVHLGFKGGRILEPSMGIGHFIGLQSEGIVEKSKTTGVELDEISGLIGRLLYPQSDIRIEGFQNAKLADGYFDVVVGNVPFGNTGVNDSKFNKLGLSKPIHDYFFAKSLDKVREGGLMMLITSRYTLDKEDSRLQHYMKDKVEFVGAIRLPRGAFKGSADTEVVTDIIVLKKLKTGENPVQEWQTSKKMKIGDTSIYVNGYFHDHPDMVLGTTSTQGSMYSANEYTVDPIEGANLQQEIQKAFNQMTANIYDPRQSKTLTQREIMETINHAPSDLKDGSYTIEKGVVFQNQDGKLVDTGLSGKQAERVKGMIDLKNTLLRLFDAQIKGNSESAIKGIRKELNVKYDKFIKTHDALHTQANVRLFADDPDAYILLAIENWDKETKKASKSDIFTKNTISKYEPVKTAANGHEALSISLTEYGNINIPRIAELLGINDEQAVKELGEAIYQDPVTEEYVTREDYLSGNIRKKLEIAESVAKSNNKFLRNVEDLQKVIPEDIPYKDIDVEMGSSWMPKQVTEEFIIDHLLNYHGWRRDKIKLSYEASTGTWLFDDSAKEMNSDYAFTTQWGSKYVTNMKLLESVLNKKELRVTYKSENSEGKEITLTDKKGTLEVREKAERLKDEFKKWIWSDESRATKLQRTYNDKYNSVVLREYDGSHLPDTLPNMNPLIKLRAHQKNAIFRATQMLNTLFAHAVGAGKTYEMIGSMMEMKRMGLIKKPMWVVPNHLVGQMASDFLKMYPQAQILVPTKKDFETKNRKKLFAKIATNNFDAIIVAVSSFEKINMSNEATARFYEEQIQAVENAIQQEVENGSRSKSRVRKSMNDIVKNLKDRMDKKLDKTKKDTDTASFEQMGIDSVVVDEAHLFKNLMYATKMQSVGGLGDKTGSDRALDMYMKVRHIQENKGRVIFATGTPISNSIAEMYHVMRYLMGNELKELDMNNFDAWADVFTDIATVLQLAPEGRGFKTSLKVKDIKNAPELLTLWKTIADVWTTDALLEKKLITHPKHQRHIVEIEQSDELAQLLDDLVARMEAIRKKDPLKTNDNPLWVTNDGRFGALDMRLIDPNIPDNPNFKIHHIKDQVLKVWKDTKKDKGAQLVFIDGTSPVGKDKPNEFGELPFNFYGELRRMLVREGIPEKEIAFIQDYKKDDEKIALFDKVNSGEIRILMGSSDAMGAGMNVQKRLKALHHANPTYKPSDLEQREGRILRQGNIYADNGEGVDIYTYVQKGSFDAYMWQLIEYKAKLINKVMQGELSGRKIEDEGELVLSAAQLKAIATGDPRIMEYENLKHEVEKLEIAKNSFNENQERAKRKLKQMPDLIKQQETYLQESKKDAAKVKSSKGDNFEIKLGSHVIKERKAAATKLFADMTTLFQQVKDGKEYKMSKTLGQFSGFDLVYNVEKDPIKNTLNESLVLMGEKPYSINIGTETGTIQSMENRLGYISSGPTLYQEQINQLNEQKSKYQEVVNSSFDKEKNLKEKRNRRDELAKELEVDKQQTEDVVLDELPGDIGEESKGFLMLSHQDTDKKSKTTTQVSSEPTERRIKGFNKATVQKVNVNSKDYWTVQTTVSGKDYGKFRGFMKTQGATYYKKDSDIPEFQGRYVFEKNPESIFVSEKSSKSFSAGQETMEHTISPKTAKQVSDKLARALKTVLRSGGVRKKGAAATFSPKKYSGNIKNIWLHNIRISAHELGHAFEERGFVGNDNELLDVAERYYPGWDHLKEINEQLSEGRAELFTLYIIDPQTAVSVAPDSVEEINQIIEADPVLQKVFGDIRKTVDAENQKGTMGKAIGSIAMPSEKRQSRSIGDEFAVDNIPEGLEGKEAIRYKVNGWFKRRITELIDFKVPWKEFDRALHEKGYSGKSVVKTLAITGNAEMNARNTFDGWARDHTSRYIINYQSVDELPEFLTDLYDQLNSLDPAKLTDKQKQEEMMERYSSFYKEAKDNGLSHEKAKEKAVLQALSSRSLKEIAEDGIVLIADTLKKDKNVPAELMEEFQRIANDKSTKESPEFQVFAGIIQAYRAKERYSREDEKGNKKFKQVYMSEDIANKTVEFAQQVFPGLEDLIKEYTSNLSNIILTKTVNAGVETQKTKENVEAGSSFYIPTYYAESNPYARDEHATERKTTSNPIHAFKGRQATAIDFLRATTYKLLEVEQSIEFKQVLDAVEKGVRQKEMGVFGEILPAQRVPQLIHGASIAKQVSDTVESILGDTMINIDQLEDSISDQVFMRFFPVDMLKQPILMNWHEDDENPGKMKRVYIRLAPDLYNSIKSMKPIQVGATFKWLSKISSVTRQFAITNPRYLMNVLSRDFFGTSIQKGTNTDLKNLWQSTIKGFLKGAAYSAGKDPRMVDAYISSGAFMSAQENLIESFKRANISDGLINTKVKGWKRTKAGRFVHILSPETVLRWQEQINRYGVWEQKARQLAAEYGINPKKIFDGREPLTEDEIPMMEKILMELGYEASEVTTNFRTHGTNEGFRKAIQPISFLHGSMQGIYRELREVKENPKRVSQRALVTLLPMSILFWAILQALDPDDKDDITSEMRDKYWILPVGNHYIFIAKPFFYTIPLGYLERALDDIAGGPAARDWNEDVFEPLKQNFTLPFLPIYGQTLLDLYANKAWYGGPIESNTTGTKFKEIDSKTSKMAEWQLELGYALSGKELISPDKFDYFIRQMFGLYGQMGSNTIDTIAGKSKPIVNGSQVGFTNKENTSSRITTKFYDKANNAELEYQHQIMDGKAKKGEPTDKVKAYREMTGYLRDIRKLKEEAASQKVSNLDDVNKSINKAMRDISRYGTGLKVQDLDNLNKVLGWVEQYRQSNK